VPDVDAIRTLASKLHADVRTDDDEVVAQTTTVDNLVAELTRSTEEVRNAETRHNAEHRRLQGLIQRREIRTGQLARLGLAPTASGEQIERAGVAARQRESRLRELAIMVSELVDIANSGTISDLSAAVEELASYDREVSALQQKLAALQSVGTTLKTWQELLRRRVEAAVHDFVLPRAAEIEDTFRSLVADPLRFKNILVEPDEAHGGLRLGLVFRDLDQASGSPEFFLSAAQMSALALSIFLSLARSQTWSWLDTILLDDPVQHLDDLDCIALLDGLRHVARQSRSKQLIISTCDRSLYHHMIRKFSLAAAPAESTLLAIRLEEDLANGVRLHYEVDSRRGGAAATVHPAGTSRSG
jgi:hypothetical protein